MTKEQKIIRAFGALRLMNIASRDTSTQRPPTNILVNIEDRRTRRCRLLSLLSTDSLGLKAATAICFADSAYDAMTCLPPWVRGWQQARRSVAASRLATQDAADKCGALSTFRPFPFGSIGD